MKYTKIGKYLRISKPVARRLLRQGVPVYMTPNNIMPDSITVIPYKMNSKYDFDATVDFYERTCCITKRTGRHASFYIEENDD